MDNANKETIQIVVFRDGDAWVAQCLEYDICAQAADLDELRSRIFETITAEVDFSIRAGKKPLEGLDRAPAHFLEMWQRRSKFTSVASDDLDPGRTVSLALCA